MNIFKKTAVMLTATLATLGVSVAIISHAAGDFDIFPSSNNYTTIESPNYYDGCYNSGDTYWTTNIQYKRHKNSNSSIYIHNTGNMGSTVTFWGLKSGTYKYCCSSLNGSPYEGKYTTQGWLVAGREQWIINYINERGCQYACIKVNSVPNWTVKGYWSPDCVGTYDICNLRTE